MDDQNTIDIGPGCFADGDLEVINYKGENFYRACDVAVRNNPEGGQSFCVKRVGHPTILHETYDGFVGIGIKEKLERGQSTTY